jgi:hypothetical protein
MRGMTYLRGLFWATMAKILNIWTYGGQNYQLSPFGGDNQEGSLFFITTTVISVYSAILNSDALVAKHS